MKLISHCVIVFALLFAIGPYALAGESDPLFVNLTTDDPHRADMGITFGKDQFDRGHPVTIFLNDKAVLIGSITNADKFASHQAGLVELMEKGATVLICSMCMQHYGINEADLLPGLKLGNPDLMQSTLFEENTKTLTW